MKRGVTIPTVDGPVRLTPRGADALRTHLATHAPDVPAWFKPADETILRNVLTRESAYLADAEAQALPAEDRSRLRNWLADSCYDLDEPLATIGARIVEAIEQRRLDQRADWERAQLQRLIDWRWHYADQMIAAASGFAVVDVTELREAADGARELIQQALDDSLEPSIGSDHPAIVDLHAARDWLLRALGKGGQQ